MKTFAATLLCATLMAASPRAAAGPEIAIVTSMGTIVVRLDTSAAPNTTKNFLHYVDAHAYDGSTFYRTVRRSSEPQAKIEVIQGGLNLRAENPMAAKLRLEPTSTTHLHNTDGTIAMARTSDPDSATTEFFIDIGDDRFLDAGGPTGPGYAAFGKVVHGMDVVRKIHAAAANGEALTPPVTISAMKRIAIGTAPARPDRAAMQSVGSRTRLIDCSHEAVYEPSTYVLACGDGNALLVRLRWSRWTNARAVAAGVYRVNDCRPYCAAGHFHDYPAEVVFDRPVRSSHGFAFDRVAMHFSGRAPSGRTLVQDHLVPTL